MKKLQLKLTTSLISCLKIVELQGDPNWLIECFSIVFNENAETVLNHEAEVRTLYREIAQLKQAVYSKVQMKKKWSQC